MIHRRSILMIATTLTATLASSAAAAGDSAPEFQVGWTIDGISDSGTLTGSGLGSNFYAYTAVTTGDTYEINWSFLVTDNRASGGFEIFASTLGITNTGTETSTFGLDIVAPVNLGAGNALYGGALGGSLTGGALGGYLASVDGDTPLWTAMVDGGFLASLGNAPFELMTGVYESADLPSETFGEPIPSLVHTAPQESMSFHLEFMLGAGSTFALTRNYVTQIPTPGATTVACGDTPAATRRASFVPPLIADTR